MFEKISCRIKIIFATIFIIALSVITAVFFFIKQPTVVAVDSLNGLELITYTNGKTEVVYRDYDYSKIEPGWVLRTKIEALPNNDLRFPNYAAPHVIFQGSTWHHAVYTYDDPGNIGCQRNILYINRTAKSSEVITKMHVPFCVLNTLDDRDINQFSAKSEDGKNLIVGEYAGGTILAKITAPEEMNNLFMNGLAVSNWENTKLAFFSGQCDLDGDTLKIYLWDTKSSTLINKRPSNLYDCGQFAGGYLVYNRDTDAFDIFSNNSDRTYLGSVK